MDQHDRDENRSGDDAGEFDLLIIGAGPAGLAAACAAQDAGLSYAVVDRAGPVQSLVGHPQQIRYFSPADEMAIGGIPFPVAGGHKPTREDALAYYRAVAAARHLNLCTWEEVTGLQPVSDPRGFLVRTEPRVAGEGTGPIVRRARCLLVCAGTFHTPRALHEVPGAGLPNVLRRLHDPTPYFGRKVLVVGGGNSAATAAMTLAEAGAEVTLAMRRPPDPSHSHLRPFIVRDLLIMAEEKRLILRTNVMLAGVTPTTVDLARYPAYPLLEGQREAEPVTLPNDFVFAMLGYQADPCLFQTLGLPLATDGLPIYDEATAETPTPGIFIAGSLSRANIILESRRRAVEIVALVRERLRGV
ncbi:MAG: NAD(P)-binding domain-containing protein [Cytophagales bacterium]|nr:NAD(P)-binding domain-containing protein [Armatimonadota bacterium]